MKEKLPTIILSVILCIGLSLVLYPAVSDWWNSFHQSRAITEYQDAVNQLDQREFEEQLEKAKQYNDNLLKKENYWLQDEWEESIYNGLLDLAGTGVMGYISIPAISVSLPIYHGTDDKVLEKAIGHIEYSSLPIGGESTHTVLSGHRGLPTAKLFSDLDALIVGDIFTLDVLNETLTYEVDKISIVYPSETEGLLITEGQDYCTLVTCTPYSINTHRLLVRGHRIDNAPNQGKVRADARKIYEMVVALGVGIFILVILFIGQLIVGIIRKNLKKRRESNNGTEG